MFDIQGITLSMNDFSSSIDVGSDRGAYRVVPDSDDPVILQLDGTLTRVLDISASGVSCVAPHVSLNMRYAIKLDLPTEIGVISTYVDISVVSDDGKVRCQFVGLNEHEQEMLHHYVLNRQKSAIASIKSGTVPSLF